MMSLHLSCILNFVFAFVFLLFPGFPFFAVGWILVWPECLHWSCVMIIFYFVFVLVVLFELCSVLKQYCLSFHCSCILYFYDFFMYFGLCMVLDFALARMPAFERCGGVSPIT